MGGAAGQLNGRTPAWCGNTQAGAMNPKPIPRFRRNTAYEASLCILAGFFSRACEHEE
jgi:hypothetical protein